MTAPLKTILITGAAQGVGLPVDGGWTADGSWNSLRLSTRA
jgi:short-subunit dehydrogenase involved in D-alanine esterification of teichoic acids